MAEPSFLEGYAGQSLDELIALEATHRIDSLVCAMEAALGRRSERDGLGALSFEERVVLAVEALEREVNNGGYLQFFTNASCVHAGEIELALRAIGCSEQAEIAARALEELGIPGAPTEDAVARAVEKGGGALEERLSALDNEYYDAQEDIAGQLFVFVKANRSKIRLQ